MRFTIVLITVLATGCAAGPGQARPGPRYGLRVWMLEIVRGKPRETGVVASIDPGLPPAVAARLAEFAGEWNRCVGGKDESWKACPIARILAAREPAMKIAAERPGRTTYRSGDPGDRFECDVLLPASNAKTPEVTVQLREQGVDTSQIWIPGSGGNGLAIRHDHLFGGAGDPHEPGSISCVVELRLLPE